MNVQTELEGPVARITLNNPDKRNAFDNTIIEALIDAFALANADGSTRVIVLQAAGKHFSAGADLGWMRKMGGLGYQENLDDALRLGELMRVIDQSAKPVIAKVHGASFGGALGLICAADIAVCDEGSRFCLSEVKLGILPAVIAPYVVRAMGERQARRYFMSGEIFNAADAHRLGVVHEVATAEQLEARVGEFIEALLAGAPQAQIEARELVARTGHDSVDQPMIDYTAALIARLRTQQEGQEGLSAFLEKRAPAWRS